MQEFYKARGDFRRARFRAGLKELLARLTGRSTELLSYEAVRRQLRAGGVMGERVEEVPIDAIVGSVNRYQDFTRDFLPRADSGEKRWAGVKVAVSGLIGLPPVDLYKIGDAYFVNDGHHRISVAREVGANKIQAHVTEIRSRVPLSPDTTPDDLIIGAEYVSFLEATSLDMLRPDADLTVTCAGQYDVLLEHIEVHRYYLGLEQGREVSFEEASANWYDDVYSPAVQVIHNLGLLHDFPDRTEADLYLWIAAHRAEIEQELGREIPETFAAADLSDKAGTRWTKRVGRVAGKVKELVIPADFEAGPSLGSWRREVEAEEGRQRLIRDILLPLSGRDTGWLALEQAIEIARLESSKIHALHVVDESGVDTDRRQRAISDRFFWRLGEVGIFGTFKVGSGNITQTICQEARWADLVIVGLSFPPPPSPLGRISSGFRRLLLASSRPVLSVPNRATTLRRPLLAYDGSPKAKEALFLATYIAGAWDQELVVVNVDEGSGSGEGELDEARAYLEEHEVGAEFHQVAGNAADEIFYAIVDQACDWLIVGGYGPGPVKEAVLGSTLDDILIRTRLPVLVCR